MKNRNNIGFFALMAIAALAIYAMSCRPSWNPEGTKFAYVYYGDKKQGVAIYDTQKDESTSMVEMEAKNEECIILEVFWLKNGRDLLYVTQYKKEDDYSSFTVIKYNLKSKDSQIITQFVLPEFEKAAISTPVFLEKEKYLWILDSTDKEDIITYQVNIKNGKFKIFGGEDNPWHLIGNKNKIFYMKPSVEKKGEYTYGRINRFPWFKQKDLFQLKIEKDKIFNPLMLKPEKKDIFAYLTAMDKRPTLIIFNSKGKQIKKIKLSDEDIGEKSDDKLALYYYCEWDMRGNRLWVIGDNENRGGLYEVDIAKETSKFIPVPGKKAMPWNLSLSPNEDMLAFSLSEEGEGINTFGLIDLRTEERKVKFIYPPGMEPKEEKSQPE